MRWRWESDNGGKNRRLVDETGETVLEAVFRNRITGPPEAALRIRSEADAMLISLAPEVGEVIREILARPAGLEVLRGISEKLGGGREEGPA